LHDRRLNVDAANLAFENSRLQMHYRLVRTELASQFVSIGASRNVLLTIKVIDTASAPHPL
jgi:hypothetical protein